MNPAVRPWRRVRREAAVRRIAPARRARGVLSALMLWCRRPLTGLGRERDAHLRQGRLLADEAVRTAERARIAAEMNDLLGHRIGLISMHAGALQLAAERQAPPLATQAELLHTTAGTAMEELRGILGVLRHRSGEETHERGTREDLSVLVAESRSAGADAALHWNATGPTDMDARTRQAVHRVTHEGLANALRHAPGAPVRVMFHDEGATVVVAVVNGAPPVTRSPGGGNRSGLVGLQERISLLGGVLDAGPRPEGGFVLSARIPVRPEALPAYVTSAELLSDGAGSRRPPSPEALAWPRLRGGICAAMLVLLPTAGAALALLITEVLH
ncbi:sensor histidine kinase [Streptomyces sp. NPDC102441]|uniref:sensor histidine kinase n=1 Tax=Streptomyces sp. NPDC102441 TaxID=3366176 RepID=UPI0037F28E70